MSDDKGDILDQSSETMRLAIRAMERHQVIPTPENYKVWYTHMAGTKAPLSEKLNKLIQDNPLLSVDQSKDIYLQFFGSEKQLDNLEDIRTELEALMKELKGFVGSHVIDNQKISQHLTKMTDKLSDNDGTISSKDSYRIVLEIISETRSAITKNELLSEQLNTAIIEVDKLKQELSESRRQAKLDALTGLANRKAFDEAITSLTDKADENQKDGEPLSLIFADIDLFKSINDKQGHLVGDQVIRVVANTLSSSLKGRDLVARYGGEEFAVLLLKTSLKNAQFLAEEIRKTMEAKKISRKDNNESIGKVTISFGVALYKPGEGVDSFVDRVDQALYLAKRTGRNKVVVAD